MITIIGEVPESFFKAATAMFELQNLSGEAEVEVIFAQEEEIKELNAETRNVDSVTDVLSFPLLNEIKPFNAENYPYDYDPQTKKVNIGSIVICRAVAERQAEEYGHSVEREETYLFVHGLLHLIGYDHMCDEDKAVMRRAEEEIMNTIGISR